MCKTISFYRSVIEAVIHLLLDCLSDDDPYPTQRYSYLTISHKKGNYAWTFALPFLHLVRMSEPSAVEEKSDYKWWGLSFIPDDVIKAVQNESTKER